MHAMKASPKIVTKTTTCRADLLRRFLPGNAPVIMDVGANAGQTIDDMLALFNDATLLSFEPDPSLFKGLQKSYTQENVKLYPYALSEKNEDKSFHRYSHSETNSFYEFDPKGYYQNRQIELLETLDVTCMTVDHFVKEENIDHIDFVKIDTQGHSLEVLKGAEETLKAGKIGCIQAEFNMHGLYTKADDFASSLLLMRECGYQFYTIINGDSEQIGHVWYDFKSGRLCAFDAFFVHNSLISD